MSEVPKGHIRFGNYKGLEITVNQYGKFFAWADDDHVEKPSLKEVQEWVDKWSKLHFKRIPILSLSDRDDDVRERAYSEAEICAIDPDGDVWVFKDGRRSKGRYGWQTEDDRFILNTPANRALANQRREILKEILVLKEKVEYLDDKMEKWKQPKSKGGR